MTSIDLGRPVSGDVVELILEDHRRFEGLLRDLRDSTSDRDAVRRAFATLHVAHAEAEEKHVYPQLRRKGAVGEHEAEHGEEESTQELLQTWQHQDPKSRKAPVPALSANTAGKHAPDLAGMPSAELAQLIQELTDQMKGAAAELHFEVAARLRDEISDLKKELRQMMQAGAK